MISTRPASPHNDKLRPRWQEVDCPSLTDKLKDWQVTPPPDAPSPNQLDQWFSLVLSALTATIQATAPHSRPSPRSKAWWTRLLSPLRKEFTKATQRAKKLQTPTPTPSRDSPSLGTSKASGPVAINKALLDHFFPPKDPLPTRGHLQRNPSAPGPDWVPYSFWKKVNLVNPTIILEVLSPLLGFGYHPPSLKTANGVVLDNPGKASYDSPGSFRIIVLFKTLSKILERIIRVRLSALAGSKGLLH